MNLKAIEATHKVAEILAPLVKEEQLQILLFLTEMTRTAPQFLTRDGPLALAPTNSSDGEYIGVGEAAELLGTTKGAIYGRIKTGTIKSYGKGHAKKLLKSEIMTWMPRKKGAA